VRRRRSLQRGRRSVRREAELREALTLRVRRRVRRDSTVSVNGTDYEVPYGYLATQLVTLATSLFDGTAPILELDGKKVPLAVVDAVKNGSAKRPPRRPTHERAFRPVDFDPSTTLEGGMEGDDDADLPG
jgi:putative transposase